MKKNNSCTLCGSGESYTLFLARDRMFGLPGIFNIKKCKKCHLAFVDPQPSFSKLKMYYPTSRYYSYSIEGKKGPFGALREYLVNHYYKPNLISSIFANLIKNVPAIPKWNINRNFLDIGCGTGDTMLLLKKLGWKVYGLDIDKNAIKYAKARGLTDARYGTYKDISNYKDGFFDAIRLYHVIEHLDDPKLCLKLIKKKLKKGGELIIGTPNIESFACRLFGRYWYNLDVPRHLFLFSPNTLKKMAEEEGFTVTNLEFCSAGGIVGSLQYLTNDLFKKRVNLIGKLWIVLAFYPIEWIFDKFGIGDVFIMRMRSKKKVYNTNLKRALSREI